MATELGGGPRQKLGKSYQEETKQDIPLRETLTDGRLRQMRYGNWANRKSLREQLGKDHQRETRRAHPLAITPIKGRPQQLHYGHWAVSIYTMMYVYMYRRYKVSGYYIHT